MTISIRIDETLYQQAKIEAQIEHRTIAGQIELWAMIGRAALDNPDLPIDFIKESLQATQEPRAQLTPFIPRSKHDI